MGSAEADALHQARSVAELTAIGGIASSIAKQRRIEHQGSREAVPSPYGAVVGGNIVDFEIGVVAIERRRSAAHEVVDVIPSGEFLPERGLQQLDQGHRSWIEA